jgi:ferritin-like metal-binding protein YciE
VTQSSIDLIRRYLEDAIAAEKSFETQLRGFAQQGDDADVQAVFLTHAEETRLQSDRLAQRLEALGEAASAGKNFFAHLFEWAPKTVQLGDGQEQRVAQNLMTAFAVEKSECAMYEALASVAAAAGDRITEGLARDIQAQETATADKIWRFISTRSKIAFNMLTAGEIDPAIETKAPDDRVIS